MRVWRGRRVGSEAAAAPVPVRTVLPGCSQDAGAQPPAPWCFLLKPQQPAQGLQAVRNMEASRLTGLSCCQEEFVF